MKPDVYYNDIDAYCCKVLAKNIERGNLPQGEIDNADIRTVDLVRLRQYRHIHLYAGIGGFPYGFQLASVPTSISILTAGFPCQPFSLAGKQKGTSDDRYLWPITLDAIRALRPQYAVLENVASLLTAERGTVFGRILSDLAEIGYDAEWQVLRASDFDAPHRRERIYVIAHARGIAGRDGHTRRQEGQEVDVGIAASTSAADDGREQVQRIWQKQIPRFGAFSWCEDVRRVEDLRDRSDIPQPLVRRNSHGVSARLHGLGNAIIPQAAQFIGECIKAHAFS